MTFSFTPAPARAAATSSRQQKAWLESIARWSAGRRIALRLGAGRRVRRAADGGQPAAAEAPDKQSAEKKSALREQALADAGVQTMLEVFPAEIRDVEEM